MMQWSSAHAWLPAALVAASCCAGCVEAGALPLKSCTVGGVDARCGSYRVPEDRLEPHGRAIELRVVVLPARSRNKAPDPIFFLHGGPGAAASTMAPFFASSPLRRRRDIILVDQRGTGESNPLECDLTDVGDLLHSMVTFEIPGIEACRDALDANADLRLYTTTIAMHDLDDVRQALGLGQINLLGGSYGTRAALEYIRRYPEQVRTAMLRGVHPPSATLPLNFDGDSQAALDAMLAACAEDPSCSESFPDTRKQIQAVLRRLDDAPALASVDDPLSGKSVEVVVTRQLFAGAIHYLLYDSRAAARLPLLIRRADAGRFDALIGALLDIATRMGGNIGIGMFLSVVCTEDVPFFDDEAIARESRDTLLGGQLSRGLKRSCRDWPRGALPEDYKQPVRADVPVLLISGEVDPVSAPHLAERAAGHLPNSLHVVLPGLSHAGWAPGCVDDLIQQLVETGSTEDLDPSCVNELSRPRFRTH
jgi:pimeloyl-ACP methyl ester carboxylesterase